MCLFYNSHSFFHIASIKFYSFLFLVCTIRCGSFQFFTIYLFIFLSCLLIQVLSAYDFSQATTRKCNIGLAINAKSFTVSCTNSITAKNCTLHEIFIYPSTNASRLKYCSILCQFHYLKLYRLVQRLSNIGQFNLRIANIGIQF